GDKEEVKPIPLLSGVGLLKCEHCGSAMVKVKGTNRRPNQYRYSCDAMRSSRIECVHTNWSFRGDQLEKAVLQLLAD
ncbi:zinc ribbon domain-containing protein, partial [Escherichia coli]|nr:zinc ribbon domain-containing protein [Escherichia coli]